MTGPMHTGIFLRAASGDEELAAALLAKGLMQGDEATFKAGYTRDNAILAACEMFRLNETWRVKVLLSVIEAER